MKSSLFSVSAEESFVIPCLSSVLCRESILCTERMKQRETIANSAKILQSKNYIRKITHYRDGGYYFLCNGELRNEIGR